MAALALLVFYLLGLAGWCVYGAIVLSSFLWAFGVLLIVGVGAILFSARERIRAWCNRVSP